MKKIVALICSVLALSLECLPWGAVLIFAGDGGDEFRSTFSYFSLTPYGYAHFSPLFTAILTVLLCVFSLLSLISKKEKIENTAFFLSVAATLLSLCPLLYGIRYFTLLGLGITLFLGASVFCLLKK